MSEMMKYTVELISLDGCVLGGGVEPTCIDMLGTVEVPEHVTKAGEEAGKELSALIKEQLAEETGNLDWCDMVREPGEWGDTGEDTFPGMLMLSVRGMAALGLYKEYA